MNAPLASLISRWWEWVTAVSWQVLFWIALIALVAWLAHQASPRVRYWLWLLVLVKVFLPPSLAASWSVGTWGLQPLWQLWHTADELRLEPVLATNLSEEPHLAADVERDAFLSPPALNDSRTNLVHGLFVIWLTGCAGLWLAVAWQYRRLRGSARRMERVDEGPLRVELERLALALGQNRVPELLLSDTAASPYLFGLWQPRIVVPRALADGLSPADMRNVLAHELSHWRRHDLWIGWMQVLAQGLLWFHPFLWWANARLRHERECACDEQVLRLQDSQPAAYGETLLRVLSAVGGRTAWQGSLVGVFEPGANLQQRLETIMNYSAERLQANKWWYPVMAAMLILFLPMAAVTGADQPAAVASAAMPAWVVATSPAIGATNVDPGITEITITFDRDMGDGMSWTGGPPDFPPKRQGAEAVWKDQRTCVLPVKLKAESYYRVGINSTSFQNFRSADGEPAPPTAIYFVTQGAPKSLEMKVRKPQIVKMVPENGATDVDPNTKALRVTFDMPMGDGMSWTGGGESFPAPSESGQAKWSGGKTCVLPVKLEPGREYTLGINSPSHINFQSKWGVPVDPVVYTFRTAGESSNPAKEGSSLSQKQVQELVEDFFKHNFRDVTQRKTIEWGKLETDKAGNLSLRYKYYASIWDKKLMIMNQVFTFDPKGDYIGYVNVEGFPTSLDGETSVPADE